MKKCRDIAKRAEEWEDLSDCKMKVAKMWKAWKLSNQALLHPKKKIQVNESRYKQCEVTPRPFVNLGIRTSALELELELILQTPLFPLPLGLSAPNLAGLWLRMRWPDPHSNVTLRYHGHVINKKRYISTFTRPRVPKLSRVVI